MDSAVLREHVNEEVRGTKMPGSAKNDLDWLENDVEESFFREVRKESGVPSSSAAVPHHVQIGDTVAGRFAIERLVGGGGMGSIYRAVDQNDGRVVAVKVLDQRLYEDRFAREAEILSRLSHPGIVRYVGHGATAGGAPFLAMEWLEGEELAQRLLRGSLSVADGVRVVRRAAEALAVAHAAGIVHRDVKPSNLFLVGGEPDAVKVFDFGVARVDGHALSQRGDVIGTPGYLAPEQALAEDDVDARADVFALGCVLYECLTGLAAFSGTHPLAVLAEEPPRLSTVHSGLAALDPLLLRALAKEREARPKDAGSFHDELTEFALTLMAPSGDFSAT